MSTASREAGSIRPSPSLHVAVQMLDAAELPAADLTAAHMAHFFYCGPANAPRGLVGLEFHGSDVLLRSLVVAPGSRSSGIGAALLARAEAHARAQGARSVYLLTTTAETFFRHRGYEPASRDSAPSEIRATREFADICPVSAAFLTKTL